MLSRNQTSPGRISIGTGVKAAAVRPEPVRSLVTVLPLSSPGAEGPRAAVDATPGSATAALATRLAEQTIERRRERAALRAASVV